MKNIAIITGASSGMGMEFVKQINEKYSKFDEIWVLARRIDRLNELSKIACEGKIRPFKIDLTDEKQLFEFSNVLAKENVAIRLLVNCAGYGICGDFSEGSYAQELGMIDLNCKALTALTYICLKYIPKRSVIVQFASIAAFVPQAKFAIYAATKSYVYSFSVALRKELKKRKISVTSVCPGPVATEFFEIADPNDNTMWYKKLVMVEAKDVVSKALQDAAKGKKNSIYGVPMKIVKTFSHLLG